MQSPKDSAPAVASVQAPAQAGAADEALAASKPVNPGGEALPPSSSSSTASSLSLESLQLPGDGIPSAETAAGGCVFLRRVRGLPAVQALLGAYAGAKAYPVVGWALSVGEKSALLATVICRPVGFVCSTPVACADWCLCKGLDVAEAVFPCVSMPPSQVYYGAQESVANCVCWPPRTAAKCLAKICPRSQKH